MRQLYDRVSPSSSGKHPKCPQVPDRSRVRPLFASESGRTGGEDAAQAATSWPRIGKLADLGQVIPLLDQQTPAALAACQKAEIEKWWPIVKAAYMKVE